MCKSNDRFREFFKKINLFNDDEFNLINNICSFSFHMPSRNDGRLIININANDVLPFAIYKKIINFKIKNLVINIVNTTYSTNYSQISEYMLYWANCNHHDKLIYNDLFEKNNLYIQNEQLNIKYLMQSDLAALNSVLNDLLCFLKKIHFAIKNINFELDENKQTNFVNAINEKNKIISKINKQLLNEITQQNTKYSNCCKINGPITKINSISSESLESIINVEGEIISIEKKNIKSNNLILYIYNIYDHNNGAIKISYYCMINNHIQNSKFNKNNKFILNEEYLGLFQKGDWIKAEVQIKSSKWSNFDFYGKIIKISKANPPLFLTPKDDEPKKRIELLIHSNMTPYDGIDSPLKIFQHAKSLGHDAIAIIDRINVQAIPDIVKAAKTTSIKPIFGCEFEIIEKNIPIVINPIRKKLIDAEYTIFDIETTGLYPVTEDLIEFGAVKWKNGKILDTINFFVKPTKPLSNVAINLSHITPEMVNDAISQKRALIKIKEWIGNDILIAHNGIKFDLAFLNKLCEKYNIDPINNCLIDTLEISHAINKNYGKHNLGFIVRKLKVDYNELQAHRANKDAEYLLIVWQDLMKKILSNKIDYIDQINSHLQTASLRATRHGYLVDVYVKNQQGIKSLYNILSLSLTERLFQKDDDEENKYLSNGTPKLYFDDLQKYKKDFIICPHPYEGEIWGSALFDNDEIFQQKIAKYDYIFVAPSKNLNHLVKQEKITTQNINKLLEKIITTSQKLGKKVCAVSDAYYLFEDERTIHKIFVYTKQLAGKRHWLYQHDGTTYVPDYHYLTTKQMLNAFKFLKDDNLITEIVVDNTINFMNEIDNNIQPINNLPFYPKIADSQKLLTNLVWNNAKKIYGETIPQEILDRINKELNGICLKGYDVIYWICHLLVDQSNKDGYLVGSRGSVGSSIIAFLANISEVNPLPAHYICPHCHYYEKYENDSVDGFDLPDKTCPKCGHKLVSDGHNIPFSSFLGINFDKTPDIDLNFSGEYQAKAHNFIKKVFDDKHAFRVGTIATTAEKMAFGYVKSYFEQTQPDFNPSNALIFALASKCVGVKRTTGQHPGGIVVVPLDKDITDFTPYSYPSNDKTKSWFTTHFEYHSIEKNLLKFDILGHDEPTILKHLHDLTKIDPRTIINNDKNVLQLFTNSESLNIIDNEYDINKIASIALPEFGTESTRKIIKETHPKTVDDLIRISGLSHGTGVWKGNAQELVKNGIELKKLIACREDIVNYLSRCGIEQNIAFDITEKIRKGQGVSNVYKQLMISKKVPLWYIDSCEKVEYLFPKAHATAYVLDALRTAWFKVYYPVQFYAVWFSIRSDVFDIETVIKGKNEVKTKYLWLKEHQNNQNNSIKLSNKQIDLIPIFEVCLEMFARGINVLNINLNKSKANEFIVIGNNILPPFASLDGLGIEVAESIVEARNERPFSSISDLQNRTKLTITLIEKLKKMHVLDNLVIDDQLRLF